MRKIIQNIVDESIEVKKKSVHSNMDRIIEASGKIVSCLRLGGKILIFGNGGSAGDAQHITAEFVNRFTIERPPLAAIALTTDSSILTSIGNDYDFNEIFEKQIKALGNPPDLALGISTSGNSKNVVRGLKEARKRGLSTLALTGMGGAVMDHCDLALTVESASTPRIQETHIVMGHLLCDLVDRQLFPQSF